MSLLFLQISLKAAMIVIVPEKVPEKTPGAWFTKLSMMAPGLRERVEGLVPPPPPLPPLPLLLLPPLLVLQLA